MKKNRIENLLDRASFVLLILSVLLLIVLTTIWIRLNSERNRERASIAPANQTPATTIQPENENVLPGGSNPTGSPVSAQAPVLKWFSEAVDINTKTGIFSSIIAGPDGSRYIAYLDDGNDDLKLATYNGSAWSLISNVGESNGQNGWYPSLAIDRHGSLHISDYSMSEQQILYGSMAEEGIWKFEVAVDHVSALDTSLAITQDDIPHIVYFDEASGQVRDAVKGASGWASTAIGDGKKEGFSFPVIVDQNNNLHVAFYGSSGGLIHATLAGNAWSSEVVDPSAGGFPSLALDRSGNLHISYYDPVNQDLKHAYQDGEEWHVVTIDHEGNVGKFNSIAVDSLGYAHISYYDEGNASLKYAYGQKTLWKTFIVDGGGKTGQYSSLILENDNPRISYYDESAQILMFAQAEIYQDRPGPQSRLSANHRSGQTFLTWSERSDLSNEVYLIYRSNAPIDQENIHQAALLARVGEGSSIFWANHYVGDGIWNPRLSKYLILENNAMPVGKGKGVFVWTVSPEDTGGQPEVNSYYTITVLEDGSTEEQFDAAYRIGPVQETIGDPEPVEITSSPGIRTHAGEGGHYYIQYMDFRHWNPTFHAPNSTNTYYGLDPNDPIRDNALAYAYDYAIFEPTPDLCGGKVPDSLPVMIFLHGARGNRYGTPDVYTYPYCAYGVYPIDESETWYFGFARHHDYRTDSAFERDDFIENYTERRILRMIYDLMRNPPGSPVDPQRIYLFGHSMGGTGSLAFAERYPNVFAAIYSGQPVTRFDVTEVPQDIWAANVAPKWGPHEINLPVYISAPNHWSDHLQKYNGAGVYDWQNLRSAFDPNDRLGRIHDDMVPFGIDHGTTDDAVLFPTQGQPLYPLLNASTQAWAGAITDWPHQWSFFGWPLPNFAKVNDVPFWNMRVLRDETVPGLGFLSGNNPGRPDHPTTYNQTIAWSASWYPWDGAPVDLPGEWQMSFCSIKAGSQQCGEGVPLRVDITPRRLQQFIVTPGIEYRWENRQQKDNSLIESGTVVADQNGVLTVRQVQILPEGNRLRIFMP